MTPGLAEQPLGLRLLLAVPYSFMGLE